MHDIELKLKKIFNAKTHLKFIEFQTKRKVATFILYLRLSVNAYQFMYQSAQFAAYQWRQRRKVDTTAAQLISM
jgi:hypothetical protein